MFVLILLAGAAFALINGMNDVSAMSGTLLSTRAAHFWQTRMLGALGVTAGILAGGDAVAATVARDLINADRIPDLGLAVWASALLGAVAWGGLARFLSIPTSATHAFIGGLMGATLVLTRDVEALHWGVADLVTDHRLTGILKVMSGLFLSPMIGFAAGWMLFRLVKRIVRRGTPGANNAMRWLQWPALLAQTFFYGMNDAHTVIGILAGAAVTDVAEPFSVPSWASWLVLGAMLAGIARGSRGIVRRMGRGMVRLGPVEAFSGQAAAAASVCLAGLAGAPTSSTQVTVSGLVGVGGAWRAAHVRWNEVRSVLGTWMLTIPAAAAAGALFGLVLGAVEARG